MVKEAKDTMRAIIENILEGPLKARVSELEKKLERLEACFWIHKHEKRGWNKGEVLVKANKWEP